MNNEPNYKHRWWTMCVVAGFIFLVGAINFVQKLEAWRELEAIKTTHGDMPDIDDCVHMWGNPGGKQRCMTYQELTWDHKGIVSSYRESQKNLEAAQHDRDFYKGAFDAFPKYCSDGMIQLALDVTQDELRLCRDQVDILQSALANQAPIQCAWDMCVCTDSNYSGLENCPDVLIAFYHKQWLCGHDENCLNCLLQTSDNGLAAHGNLDHCWIYAYQGADQ